MVIFKSYVKLPEATLFSVTLKFLADGTDVIEKYEPRAKLLSATPGGSGVADATTEIKTEVGILRELTISLHVWTRLPQNTNWLLTDWWFGTFLFFPIVGMMIHSD